MTDRTDASIDFPERDQKAFDFCSDATKQLITLSTGIIALGITFSKDFLAQMPHMARVLATYSWGIFLVSVIAGICALLAMTSTLASRSSNGSSMPPPSIWEGSITFFSKIQVIAFGAAMILTVWFGIIGLRNIPPKQPEKDKAASSQVIIVSPQLPAQSQPAEKKPGTPTSPPQGQEQKKVP